jgi:arylsulfatase A
MRPFHALFLFLIFILPTLAGNAQAKPNVILMMADDLGYNDLACYGSQLHKTPVLDKMAAEGIRLTSFYAGATVCTPSRMALLTGAYPPRSGWPGGVVGYGIKPANGLSPEATTMAEVFKGDGYRTALVGKWHLGDVEGLQPMNQGFDEAYFINKSNNQTKQLWREGKLVADPFDNRRLSELFTQECIRFIQENKSQPFLLYIPFTAPHFPAQAHPDWEGHSKNEAYGDVVEELDSRVGEILGTLDKHGLAGNTIVVFISDNGPEPGQKKWAQANPFRGLKWSSMEGGTRVPCIVRWPGKIPSGQTNGDLTAAIDLLPTLAHACGVRLPAKSKPKVDGINVWDTLTAKGTPHPRKDLLYWEGWATPQAIREGDWKLYVDPVKGIEGSESRAVLVNLADDPAEENDLASKHPGKVAALKSTMRFQLEDIRKNRLGLGGKPLDKAPKEKQGKWLK